MSFLLDTNVVSELQRRLSGRSDPQVCAWSDSIASTDASISVITILEIEIGVLRIARRDVIQGARLREGLRGIEATFAGRILSVDVDVARVAASMHVPDRRRERDALIAATALVHGLTVVTRNVKDFAPMGVPLLNPWEWVQ